MNAKTKKFVTPSKKVVTTMNYKRSKGEINNLDSMTIPNDTLSIRQLLINHSRGLGNLPNIHGVYTEDQVAPRYSDPLDRLRDMENLKDRISEFEENEKSQQVDLKTETAKEEVQPTVESTPEEN
jgi:hypothetical protein